MPAFGRAEHLFCVDQAEADDAMQEALLLSQHASGLDETGSLDTATLAALRTPRCGVPDYYPPSPVVRERLQTHALHAQGAHVLHDVEAFTDVTEPQEFVASAYVWQHSELRYGFGAPTGDTSLQSQRQALVAALATWTPHIPVIVACLHREGTWRPTLIWRRPSARIIPKPHGTGGNPASPPPNPSRG